MSAPGLHGGHDRFAGIRVGHPEDRAVGHCGVAQQHGLDLGRGHLESLELDHLLDPVGDVQPAGGRIGSMAAMAAGVQSGNLSGAMRGLLAGLSDLSAKLLTESS